jgi:hypothetical protein
MEILLIILVKLRILILILILVLVLVLIVNRLVQATCARASILHLRLVIRLAHRLSSALLHHLKSLRIWVGVHFFLIFLHSNRILGASVRFTLEFLACEFSLKPLRICTMLSDILDILHFFRFVFLLIKTLFLILILKLILRLFHWTNLSVSREFSPSIPSGNSRTLFKIFPLKLFKLLKIFKILFRIIRSLFLLLLKIKITSRVILIIQCVHLL